MSALDKDERHIRDKERGAEAFDPLKAELNAVSEES